MPPEVPLVRATAIRAFEPFDGAEEAAAWLATATVRRGCGARRGGRDRPGAAQRRPPRPRRRRRRSLTRALGPERAVAVRVGYGSGEETAEGAYSEAVEVDVWATGASPRRRRQEDLRPQERVAGVLRGRDRIAACEPLLLRARADLDAGRRRERPCSCDRRRAPCSPSCPRPSTTRTTAATSRPWRSARKPSTPPPSAALTVANSTDAGEASGQRRRSRLAERILRRLARRPPESKRDQVELGHGGVEQRRRCGRRRGARCRRARGRRSR